MNLVQLTKKTLLDLSDDAANQNWGGSWRMPTVAEIQELLDNCTIEDAISQGVKGQKLTSKNNTNSIFFPLAGILSFDELGNESDFESDLAFYWSSQYINNPIDVAGLVLEPNDVYLENIARTCGGSVRAVTAPQK